MSDIMNNVGSLPKRLLLIAIAVLLSACMPLHAGTQQIEPVSVQSNLEKLEVLSGGRLGVSAINTASNTTLQYRAEEGFPLWSTAKVMVVSAILKQSMTDHHLLQQKITYTKEDLGYSPITEKHFVDGMTISDLCAAAIMQSDNTAMNLLIKKLGGPKVVTAFARSIGDNTFKFYFLNPELNSVIYPSNLRFTSTPAAMAKSLQRLALGKILGPRQRKQLLGWLKANTTGDTRIRAGVPKDWNVGDKTGTGDSYGTTNDIAIIWPPKAPPIIMAIYFTTQHKSDTKHHDDVIVAAARILIRAFYEHASVCKIHHQDN